MDQEYKGLFLTMENLKKKNISYFGVGYNLKEAH